MSKKILIYVGIAIVVTLAFANPSQSSLETKIRPNGVMTLYPGVFDSSIVEFHNYVFFSTAETEMRSGTNFFRAKYFGIFGNWFAIKQ